MDFDLARNSFEDRFDLLCAILNKTGDLGFTVIIRLDFQNKFLELIIYVIRIAGHTTQVRKETNDSITKCFELIIQTIIGGSIGDPRSYR